MAWVRAVDPRAWRQTARIYLRGTRLVFPTGRWIAATVGLLLLTSTAPVAQAWLVRLVVDRLGSADAGAASTGWPLAVPVLVAAYVLTLVVPAALEPVRQTLTANTEDRAVAEVDRHIIAAGTRLTDLTSIERPAFHDRANRVQNAASLVPRFVPVLPGAVGTCVTLCGLLVLLGGLQPLIPVALALSVVPHVAQQRRMHRLQFATMSDQSRAAREMDYCVKVTTQPAGAKEVRAFGLGDWFLRRFEERFAASYAEVRKVRLAHLRSSAAFSLLHAVALVGGFWYVAGAAAAGRLSLGDVALYLNAVIQFEASLFLLSMQAGMVHEMGLYFRQLFGFVDDARPGVALPRSPDALVAPERLRTGVAVHGAEFRYPEGDSAILRGVDATLRAGTVTALVGANGSGKSTLVKLLTRMYDPTAGEVRLDGAPLPAYDLDGLRLRMATVFQDFARFSLTAADNIAVGNTAVAESDSRDLESRVREAARKAGADVVVASLPQGYDTPLTRLFEGGVELSGGEWQKVATARGFLRDAALVILDEPTSALDADAERRLFDDFRSLMAGRTALLVSHRFSTVRMADHIVVLDGGRVVEAGSHDELMAVGGHYATLFDLQASRYR